MTNTALRKALTVTAVTAVIGSSAAMLTTTPSQAQQAGTTLTLLQKDASDHFVDAPPLGGAERPPSPGDSYYMVNNLLDPTTKQELGKVHGVCATTVPGRRAVALCTFALRTGNGVITVAGLFPFVASPVTLAVTGGTGNYANARGTATWTAGKGDYATWKLTLVD